MTEWVTIETGPLDQYGWSRITSHWRTYSLLDGKTITLFFNDPEWLKRYEEKIRKTSFNSTFQIF